MHVVIVGRTGQLAQALMAYPAAWATRVTALGRDALDLSAPDRVGETVLSLRPDVVVNAAAYTAVDKAEAEEAVATAVNADAPGALAWAAARCGAALVHISTDYVFDGSKTTPYLEDDPVAPINAYGRSKLAGEVAVRESGANAAILRTSWVYSATGNNFVRTMIRLAETRDVVRVVGDQHGGPTSAVDLADACWFLAERLAAREAPSGVYHVSSADYATWAEFAEAIFAGWKARGGKGAIVEPITSAEYPTPARRPANSRLHTGKVAALGLALPQWRASLDRCLTRLDEAGRVS